MSSVFRLIFQNSFRSSCFHLDPAPDALTFYREGYCKDFHEVPQPSGGFTSAQQCYDKIMNDNISGCAIGNGLKIALAKDGGSRAGRCLCQKSGTICVVQNNLGANGLDLWSCGGSDCRSKHFCLFL